LRIIFASGKEARNFYLVKSIATQQFLILEEERDLSSALKCQIP
jgi:hypothetical protein